MLNTILVKADSEVSREPDIVFGGDNYLVVWSDGTFGGEYKVQAARVTPDGAVLDSGVVFGMGAYCEYRPTVAFDGERYFAVWYIGARSYHRDITITQLVFSVDS